MRTVITDLHISPQCQHWHSLVSEAGQLGEQRLFDRPMYDWRAETRETLGLDTQRPIVATGHQTLLWHPGILVKYLAMQAFGEAANLGRANLIVDQHADGFGSFDMPIRRADGSLTVRRVELTIPRKGVPMGLHESFEPPVPAGRIGGACASVDAGVLGILTAIAAHREQPNAALQMARALADLMQPWVQPPPNVCASDLMRTNFSRALLRTMADDPQRCGQLYNRAVRALPEAGIRPLLVRDDYVELPLWRIREDGTRMHAYDNDVQTWLDGADITLMPRALFMTALIRLVMCDVFIHGTGGANYDRAMEKWIRDWLGVQANPIAVATATLHLPLDVPGSGDDVDDIDAVSRTQQAYRHMWHDPTHGGTMPSAAKQALLDRMAMLPRRSLERRRVFFEMHGQLETQRANCDHAIARAKQAHEQALRAAGDQRIARRRDWPFSLYPTQMIDELSRAVHAKLNCPDRSSV